MSRRLIKEFHPFLLPGFMAVLLAIAPLLCPLLNPDGTGEFLSFVRGLAFFAFVCVVVLLACLPFGVELQENTFPLLLSQPMNRDRIWMEKVGSALAAVAGVVLVQFWANQHSESPWQVKTQDEFSLVIFLGVAICSGSFWTLVARSSLGGMAFALGSQLMAILALDYLWEKISNEQMPWSPPAPAMLVLGPIYAGILLWLGRRKFANLELRNPFFAEGAASQAFSGRNWRPGWLRCRPTGPVANLIRKELRQQKPVFLIAALVCLCWIAALVLYRLAPLRKPFLEDIGNLFTGTLMVLVPLLAGCISLGEEKALGVNSWQLTLPIAPLRQWWIKLAVAAGVAISLGLMLPYTLAWMSSSAMDTGLAQALRDKDHVAVFLSSLAVIGTPFLLSFWAAASLANTVRAALVGIAGILVLFGCVALGAWCGSEAGRHVETPLLRFLIAQFQLVDAPAQRTATVAGYSCVLLGVVIVLIQSLAQFRRPQPRMRTTVWYAATIAGFTFLASFWVFDIQLSRIEARFQLHADIAQALKSMGAIAFQRGHSQEVSLADLERTGQLSWAAKKWLRDARITIQPVEWRTSPKLPSPGASIALLRFPNGQQEFIGPY